MFLSILSADGKYPVPYCKNLQLPIQMQVSEKREAFSDFLFHFWNLHKILNILKKNMMVIAKVYPKLQSVKNFLTPLCKKCRFGPRLDSRHVKVSGIHAKYPWECFYHVFSSILGKLFWKMSPLGLDEM